MSKNKKKTIITANKLTLNPELVQAGVVEGDIMGIPEEGIAPMPEAPELPVAEIVPVVEEVIVAETPTPTESKMDGKELMFAAHGKVYDGKVIASARWAGDRLVLFTTEQTEFTLTGTQISEFLNA